MGILNVTPDSFSAAGEHSNPDDALARVRTIVEEGARIVDVGGESTRPGAARVPPDVQLQRIIPVIERIRAEGIDVLISIDTTRADVARPALEAGATIVNDVSGATEDPDILQAVAAAGAGLVLMHRLRPPDQDRYSHRYDPDGAPDYSDAGGVVHAVRAALARSAEMAIAAGVARESIVLDPGLGFGKTVEQNFALITGMGTLGELGYPLLSGASRKSFIGKVTGIDEPRQRVHASIAVSVAHYLAGVRIFRIHDVRANAQALTVAATIAAGTEHPE